MSSDLIKSEEFSTLRIKIYIFVLYFISYGLMIVNPGVFWDDWCVFNNTYENIYNMLSQGGFPYTTGFYVFMSNISNGSASLYHLLIFILYYLSSIIIFDSLLLLKISKEEAALLSLFAALIPYNITRITIICFHYTVGNFFCYFGIYLFIKNYIKKNIIIRLLSIISMFISYFFLNSTLVFIPFSIAFIVLFFEKEIKSFSNFLCFIGNKVICFLDFVLLPFVYWMTKIFFFKPAGEYTGYNEIHFHGLLNSFSLLIKTIQNSFLKLFSYCFLVIESPKYFVLFIIGLLFIFYSIKRTGLKTIEIKTEHIHLKILSKKIAISYPLICGILFFIIAAFPYNVVSLVPRFGAVSSRHQILLVTGSSSIILYSILEMVNNIVKNKKKNIVFIFLVSLILSMFITTNIKQNISFLRVHYIQESIENNFRKSEEFYTGRNFLFDHNFNDNFFIKGLRYYVLTGIAYEIVKTEDKMFVLDENKKDWLGDNNIEGRKTGSKKSKNIILNKSFDYSMYLRPGRYELSDFNVLKVLFYNFFDKKKYENVISKISVLEIEQYQME